MKAKVYRLKDDPEITESIDRLRSMGLPNAESEITKLEAELREEVDFYFDESDIAYMIIFTSDITGKKIMSLGLKSGFDCDLVYDKAVETKISKILG